MELTSKCHPCGLSSIDVRRLSRIVAWLPVRGRRLLEFPFTHESNGHFKEDLTTAAAQAPTVTITLTQRELELIEEAVGFILFRLVPPHLLNAGAEYFPELDMDTKQFRELLQNIGIDPQKALQRCGQQRVEGWYPSSLKYVDASDVVPGRDGIEVQVGRLRCDRPEVFGIFVSTAEGFAAWPYPVGLPLAKLLGTSTAIAEFFAERLCVVENARPRAVVYAYGRTVSYISLSNLPVQPAPSSDIRPRIGFEEGVGRLATYRPGEESDPAVLVLAITPPFEYPAEVRVRAGHRTESKLVLDIDYMRKPSCCYLVEKGMLPTWAGIDEHRPDLPWARREDLDGSDE